MYHTLVFVPSYFDFVRLRNWFQKSDLDFGDVCEYTKDNRIAEYRLGLLFIQHLPYLQMGHKILAIVSLAFRHLRIIQ